MIRKTRNWIFHTLFHRPHELTVEDVAQARDYIKDFWPQLKRVHRTNKDTLIGLPHPYLVPAHDEEATFTFDEMYYWDSYFMVQGMLRDPSSQKLVMGILDNLFFLIKQYGMVPNANKTYLLSHSQPPLLTSFIFDVYEAYNLDRRWLEQAIAYAKEEYNTVWMGVKKPFEHQVYQGLSRYYDINVLHDLAEAESGWDMTTRFERKCLDYLPIDLNAFLYQYEQDFIKAATILQNPEEVKKWKRAANVRKKNIHALLWNARRGNFFDYNYKKKVCSPVASLASYAALWAGVATKEQAARMVKDLSRFEVRGGLATTEDPALKFVLPSKMPTQWAYPNGWAPLHFLTIKGLERYGYHTEAQRIARKWLKTNVDWFQTHGVFLEKYNVADPLRPPVEGLYPSQTGFGWTNAVFERLCQDYIDTEGGKKRRVEARREALLSR